MDHTRRYFLKTAGGIAAYAGLAPMDGLFANPLPNAQVASGKSLVVVFLRGGIDGLNLVVPYGDKHYYDHRKNLAIARPGGKDGAIDIDGFFGLHPSARALEPLFKDHAAVALQAVGYAQNTRSHFEEQDKWETGVIGDTISADGWLNRHLVSSQGHGTIRAVSIGGNLPRILRGRAAAYAIRGIADLAMPKLAGDQDALQAALESAYCTKQQDQQVAARDLMAQTAKATLEGARQLQAIAAEKYQAANGAKYPETGIAKNFREAARLIKAGIGTEVIEIDYGGWDTHNGQGGANGAYANQLRALSEAIAAFHQDMGSAMKDALVVTLSDFGRTVRENGTNGTDHGWANCMMMFGGAVKREDKVLGKWPGLAPEQLYQNRDLDHTTDFRDVIGELVSNHLGNPNLQTVLPGHQFKPVGVVA
jgi:uncharacterized protein (DUF1501 family)